MSVLGHNQNDVNASYCENTLPTHSGPYNISLSKAG